LVSSVFINVYGFHRLKLSVKQLLFGLVFIFFLFEISYVFAVQIDVNNFFDINIAFFQHFARYIISGVVGLNEHIAQGMPIGIDSDILFMPFVNAINFLQGIPARSVVSSYLVYIDNVQGETSNVKTIFGTILIYGGFFVGTLYVILLGLVSYLSMMISHISKDIWYKFIFGFIMSALFMGWFELYFNNLTLIEVPVYMLLLSQLSKVKFVFKNRKNAACE
jgi:hypothetical protein